MRFKASLGEGFSRVDYATKIGHCGRYSCTENKIKEMIYDYEYYTTIVTFEQQKKNNV